MSLIFFPMSIGFMSHADFKKWQCHAVEFKGQRPYYIVSSPSWAHVVSQSMALFSIQAQVCVHLRDWSLNTGRGGGYKTGEGWHVKFYPYKKAGGGAEKVLALLKRGHNKFWGTFYAVA